MKALLQDCYMPVKKPDSQIDEKHSFSFRETQLKESFEKEKKLIDKQFEQMKNELNHKNSEILELKDIIRLKNQEYELLKQNMKDNEINNVNNPSQRQHLSNRNPSEHSGTSRSRVPSSRRSNEAPILPYNHNRKEADDMHMTVSEIEKENRNLKTKLAQYEALSKNGQQIDGRRQTEQDGTVVIGGMSHMMNTTEENDQSLGNCNIDMSPIEPRERDISADEGLTGVFDRTTSNPNHKSSKRRLNFEEQEAYENQNMRNSVPELDEIRSNKDTLYQQDQIYYLRQE